MPDRIKLLVEEITDEPSRENFQKLDELLNSDEFGSGGQPIIQRTVVQGEPGPPGQDGAPGEADFLTEHRTISSIEAGAKQLTLANIPSKPNELTLTIVGGGPQFNGTSYEVSGNTITWLNKTLETLIEEGELLVIQYQI